MSMGSMSVTSSTEHTGNILGKVKSEGKKLDRFKNLPLIKTHICCLILMKLGERQSFSPSFMRIGKKLWIFY